MTAPFLIEEKFAATGMGFTQRWMIEPPASNVPYRVVRDAWDEDFNVRTIYEIELV